ncbi:MAG: flagellar protein [Oscillospiraceae bacterium]|jgi:flagellar operon protein|nr:flagellar protein [Oscillospiraceae bacterium]
MSEINRLNIPITTGRPGPRATLPGVSIQGPGTDPKTGKTFRELLEVSVPRAQELTFSKHALQRVEQRGISLSQKDLQRLNDAAGMAGEKGITDSLVYMNDTAFIVNVPNRVVVTVVDFSDSDQSVFTNINGAVIL